VSDWSGYAQFGSDNKYRYTLGRCFFTVPGNKTVSFIMLNPSTADAGVSDPTVRRCEGYAKLWGFNRLTVLNIFALRSTDPKALYASSDPVGPDNDEFILACVKTSDLVVCAWGVHGKFMDRGNHVRMLIDGRCKPTYLKLTKDGIPSHPLYLKGSLKPKPLVL
jgi:hypothetical protein